MTICGFGMGVLSYGDLRLAIGLWRIEHYSYVQKPSGVTLQIIPAPIFGLRGCRPGMRVKGIGMRLKTVGLTEDGCAAYASQGLQVGLGGLGFRDGREGGWGTTRANGSMWGFEFRNMGADCVGRNAQGSQFGLLGCTYYRIRGRRT